MVEVGRKEIENILPHRECMLIVEKVDVDGKNGVGYYTPKETDFWVKGHFPNNPILPGFVLLECMAQTAGVAYAKSEGLKSCFPVLLIVKDAQFFETITVGDDVKIIAKFERVYLKKVISYNCSAFVNGKMVSNARLFFGDKQ